MNSTSFLLFGSSIVLLSLFNFSPTTWAGKGGDVSTDISRSRVLLRNVLLTSLQPVKAVGSGSASLIFEVDPNIGTNNCTGANVRMDHADHNQIYKASRILNFALNTSSLVTVLGDSTGCKWNTTYDLIQIRKPNSLEPGFTP